MEASKELPPSLEIRHPLPPASPLRKIIMVASIASGVTFGWALQLSLLTPYVQLLGIPHTWASFIWLCGPISGMVVQPVVGYYSDKCTSRFGRRRPFIVAGAAFVAVAVFLIGFAADIGHASGDPLGKAPKPRAISIFIVGFWILDVANNMLQGPCRAFLADLSGGNASKMRTANALFSFFMAVGNVLGFAAGSYTHLYKMFPFTVTTACDVYCANLKSCFFLCITLLLTLTALASILIKENVHSRPEQEILSNEKVKEPFFLCSIYGAMKNLPRPMWFLLLVTFLNIFGWFPFLLFDTDWMGREVYGGKVGEGDLYARGVRAGALGLMIQSIVVGVVSLGIELMSRGLGGVKRLWGCANFLLAICLAMTVLITKLAESTRRYTTKSDGTATPLPPVAGVKAGALAIFGVLGIPQAATYSIPFALASIYSSKTGAGQGLTIGVLNLSAVIPQLIVSVVGGPWDELFGGGNLPGFIVGAISAAASGFFALTLLPSPPPDFLPAKATTAAGFH